MAGIDPSPTLLNLPPRIALVALEAELSRYLTQWIRQHWPAARVQACDAGQPVVADLQVVDREPRQPSSIPTLWLAEPDHGGGLIRLGPYDWRTALPSTGARLVQRMRACLAQRP